MGCVFLKPEAVQRLLSDIVNYKAKGPDIHYVHIIFPNGSATSDAPPPQHPSTVDVSVATPKQPPRVPQALRPPDLPSLLR